MTSVWVLTGGSLVFEEEAIPEARAGWFDDSAGALARVRAVGGFSGVTALPLPLGSGLPLDAGLDGALGGFALVLDFFGAGLVGAFAGVS